MSLTDIVLSARKIYCALRSLDLLDLPGEIRNWYLSKENEKFKTEDDF